MKRRPTATRRKPPRVRNPARRAKALIERNWNLWSTADGLVMASLYRIQDGDPFRGWVVERSSDRAVTDPIPTKREALQIAEEMYAEIPQHTRDFWRGVMADKGRNHTIKIGNPSRPKRRPAPRKKSPR